MRFRSEWRTGVAFSFRVWQAAEGGRAATELRLGRGTLLEHHASSPDLRTALRAAVSDASSSLELPDDARETLTRLRTLFTEAGLPGDLHLSIITPQGWSLLNMVGLLEGALAEEAVPLALAGAGTRQLALFRLASALIEGSPIVLLDEPEFGFEPYRQRRLVTDIRTAIGERGQAFLTTHSPAILQALNAGEISRLDVGLNPVGLSGRHIGRVQKESPDALLSRLPILCEGATEAGFLDPVLNGFAEGDHLADIDALGIRLLGRTGQPTVLDEADELLNAGLACGLFVDNEKEHSGRRANLAAQHRCAFGTWSGVCNIEEAVAKWLPWDQLPRVLGLAASLRKRPLDDLLQQVGDCIGKPGANSLGALRTDFGEDKVRDSLASAMQSKKNAWFKTSDGGLALGQLILDLGVPAEMLSTIEPFWHRVRQEAGWG